jgi:hypothetical protein
MDAVAATRELASSSAGFPQGAGHHDGSGVSVTGQWTLLRTDGGGGGAAQDEALGV